MAEGSPPDRRPQGVDNSPRPEVFIRIPYQSLIGPISRLAPSIKKKSIPQLSAPRSHTGEDSEVFSLAKYRPVERDKKTRRECRGMELHTRARRPQKGRLRCTYYTARPWPCQSVTVH